MEAGNRTGEVRAAWPRRLPLTATDGDLLAAVREWVSLLAAERYSDALAFVSQPPQDHWTPDLLRAVIENYGSPEPRSDGRRFRVTPIEQVEKDGGPRHEVDREAVAPGEVAAIWFDLPLNGRWSDLTATLTLVHDGHSLVLRLDDVHVM